MHGNAVFIFELGPQYCQISMKRLTNPFTELQTFYTANPILPNQNVQSRLENPGDKPQSQYHGKNTMYQNRTKKLLHKKKGYTQFEKRAPERSHNSNMYPNQYHFGPLKNVPLLISKTKTKPEYLQNPISRGSLFLQLLIPLRPLSQWQNRQVSYC